MEVTDPPSSALFNSLSLCCFLNLVLVLLSDAPERRLAWTCLYLLLAEAVESESDLFFFALLLSDAISSSGIPASTWRSSLLLGESVEELSSISHREAAWPVVLGRPTLLDAVDENSFFER